jgi:hypothetical protein
MRGPSGPQARTVRPTGTDCPDRGPSGLRAGPSASAQNSAQHCYYHVRYEHRVELMVNAIDILYVALALVGQDVFLFLVDFVSMLCSWVDVGLVMFHD